MNDQASTSIPSFWNSIDTARKILSDYNLPTEFLARLHSKRKLLFFKEAVLTPVDKVWHVGVFLLSPAGLLYKSGRTTVAGEPGHPGHTSLEREKQRSYKEAARKGSFTDGDVIHFWEDTAPPSPILELPYNDILFIKGTEVYVRWNLRDRNAFRPFKDYLEERVSLLIERQV